MGSSGCCGVLFTYATLVAVFVSSSSAIDVFHEWHVTLDTSIKPLNVNQTVWSTTLVFVAYMILLVILLPNNVSMYILLSRLLLLMGYSRVPLLMSQPMMLSMWMSSIIWMNRYSSLGIRIYSYTNLFLFLLSCIFSL